MVDDGEVARLDVRTGDELVGADRVDDEACEVVGGRGGHGERRAEVDDEVGLR